MARLWSRWLAALGASAIALAFGLNPGGTSVVATAAGSNSVRPNGVGTMDCNGHSPVYKSAKAGMGAICADPLGMYDGQPTRFYDNGHYVGHDEPSVKFISRAAGSANNMTYYMRLARDPSGAPTATSSTTTKYAQLSPAPWFGLPLCDPKSYPQNPCTPDSDTNLGLIQSPTAAGSAFMELQFYPPGFQPFVDGPSCDAVGYCAAVNIFSVECRFGFVGCNNNCIEPGNFAYLQTDGVPAGPPSPQLTDIGTLTPNRKTLLMRQGDFLQVTIRDTAAGLLTRVVDLSSGQSGFMIASAANGFMNTNIADCSGTPFSFHAEYSTAQQQNQVPWTALATGVLMENELGHFEPCSSVASALPVNTTYSNGRTFSDPSVFQTCQGGLEPNSSGEGPCSPSTGVCINSRTEGGTACPTDNFTSAALCEFSDASCMPAGPRTIINNGVSETVSWPVAGCLANIFQNGDLDFEGTSYQHGWPDGSSTHPKSFQYIGPFDAGGHSYPTVQFETNVPSSEIRCQTATGAGCTVPPVGAAFYPFWTIGKLDPTGSADANRAQTRSACVWNFGAVIPGTTLNPLGGVAQYGTPDIGRFAGTFVSQPVPNPQFASGCL